jgi:transposase InsO family protein
MPQDNAVVESFFSYLKRDKLYRTNFKSEREFYECVDNYMLFHNTERPHSTLAQKTADKYEALFFSKIKVNYINWTRGSKAMLWGFWALFFGFFG